MALAARQPPTHTAGTPDRRAPSTPIWISPGLHRVEGGLHLVGNPVEIEKELLHGAPAAETLEGDRRAAAGDGDVAPLLASLHDAGQVVPHPGGVGFELGRVDDARHVLCQERQPAAIDDGVVVVDGHHLGLVHLPEAVVGQIPARHRNARQPGSAEGDADAPGGKGVDAVELSTQSIHRRQGHVDAEVRVGAELRHGYAHVARRECGAHEDEGNAIHRL